MDVERAPRQVRITERDRELLAFMAEHRLVLSAHVEALLGVSASAAAGRLRALAAGGFISSRRIFHGQPAAHQISRTGLRAIGSQLPRPQIDLRCYAHDVDLAWLWLIARSGTFGPLREVLSERQLRSRDARGAADTRSPGAGARPDFEPLGVRLGGTGPHGRPRLHYPDLLLITPRGRRVALELELSAKGQVRREQILAGYGSDARVDGVLYLVKDPRIARSIRASARRLGISWLVHVQRASSSQPAVGAAEGRGALRAAGVRSAPEAVR